MLNISLGFYGLITITFFLLTVQANNQKGKTFPHNKIHMYIYTHVYIPPSFFISLTVGSTASTSRDCKANKDGEVGREI